MLRQKRGSLEFWCLIIVLSSIGSNDACKTPRDKDGACIVITECKELNDLLKNRNKTPDEEQYLRDSQCGQEGSHPKVCCETSSVPSTPVISGRQSEELLFSECGVDHPSAEGGDRILGGVGMHINIWQYPWTGIIEYQNSVGKILQPCMGSLIAKRYFVTAAHCVTGAILQSVGTPMRVKFGEFDKSNKIPECTVIDAEGTKACMDKPVVIPIEQSIPHPDYSRISGGRRRIINDIAVIRLAREAPYTDFIRPICLPSSDITAGLKTGELQLTVTGWGDTERGSTGPKKRHLNMPFTDLNDCQTSYDQVNLSVSLWDKQLCAGGQPGKDSCYGDNGGPLMHIDNTFNHTLIGVVSFGPYKCGMAGVSGVYTKVFAYLDWIKEQMMKYN